MQFRDSEILVVKYVDLYAFSNQPIMIMANKDKKDTAAFRAKSYPYLARYLNLS